MDKKYEIKLPVSMYIQLTGCISITLLLIFGMQINNYSSVLLVISSVCILLLLVLIFMLLKTISRSDREIEVTKNIIRINKRKVPIQKIEKIIIQGYFNQSIGIKLYGKKFVSTDFHFRFRNNEEVNIEELKQWASMNEIKVTSGKIYRWI